MQNQANSCASEKCNQKFIVIWSTDVNRRMSNTKVEVFPTIEERQSFMDLNHFESIDHEIHEINYPNVEFFNKAIKSIVNKWIDAEEFNSDKSWEHHFVAFTDEIDQDGYCEFIGCLGFRCKEGVENFIAEQSANYYQLGRKFIYETYVESVTHATRYTIYRDVIEKFTDSLERIYNFTFKS